MEEMHGINGQIKSDWLKPLYIGFLPVTSSTPLDII